MKTVIDIPAAHTPTPWHFSDLYGREIIHTASGVAICALKYGSRMQKRDEANAALIVRAVNSHAELVSALVSAMSVIPDPDDAEDYFPGISEYQTLWNRLMHEKARAALAKAKSI